MAGWTGTSSASAQLGQELGLADRLVQERGVAARRGRRRPSSRAQRAAGRAVAARRARPRAAGPTATRRPGRSSATSDGVAVGRRAMRAAVPPRRSARLPPTERSTPSRRARASTPGRSSGGPAATSATSAAPESGPGASSDQRGDRGGRRGRLQPRPPLRRGPSPAPGGDDAHHLLADTHGHRSATAGPDRWRRRRRRRHGRRSPSPSSVSEPGGETTGGSVGRDGDRHRAAQRVRDARGDALQGVSGDRAGDERQRRGPGSGRIRSPVRHRLSARSSARARCMLAAHAGLTQCRTLRHRAAVGVLA